MRLGAKVSSEAAREDRANQLADSELVIDLRGVTVSAQTERRRCTASWFREQRSAEVAFL